MEIKLNEIATAPFNTELLLYWKEAGHFENGTIYNDGDNGDGIYHVLFDGESMNFMPSHWCYIPKFKF